LPNIIVESEEPEIKTVLNEIEEIVINKKNHCCPIKIKKTAIIKKQC